MVKGLPTGLRTIIRNSVVWRLADGGASSHVRIPPPHLLKGEVELYVPWMLYLAEGSPRVVIRDLTTTSLGDDLYKVTVEIENEGYLPTNITERALEVAVAVPVRAIVELENAELVSGSARTNLGHISGTRGAQGNSGTSETRRTVEYVVRASNNRARMTLTIASEKGGTTRRDVALRD